MKTLTRAELRAARVERRADDHKGIFGHALIVGGSRGMIGAPMLAARAALRSGAGLVTIAVPASLQAAVAAAIPEALTLGLPESSSGCLRPEGAARLKTAQRERGYTVFALGPGLTRHPDTARFVVATLAALALPAVLDADALNILAEQDHSGVRQLLRGRGRPCVFTPHPGEAARMLDLTSGDVQRSRESCAVRLAREWGGVALLKGRHSLISDGHRTVTNITGGPGLAKGGSGDVLSGLIAGLWAQMVASGRVDGDLGFKAAALGAHLHGLAGDAAERANTAWAMTAGDLVDALPEAFRSL